MRTGSTRNGERRNTACRYPFGGRESTEAVVCPPPRDGGARGAPEFRRVSLRADQLDRLRTRIPPHGRLRTDEDLTLELLEEFGCKRRGSRIGEALRTAIARFEVRAPLTSAESRDPDTRNEWTSDRSRLRTPAVLTPPAP